MRLTRTAALALALTAAAATGASSADAAPPSRACKVVKNGAGLVPNGAAMIVQIDGARAARSKLYRDLRGAMERDLEVKDGLAVLEACDLAPEDLHELTVGAAEDDRMVAVIKGRGIGKPRTLQCLRDQIAARSDGKKPWTSRKSGCYRVLSNDGKDFGFVLDDTTIVMAGEKWADQVRDLIGGKGTAAVNGNLAPALAGVDRTKTVWFAGALDDRVRAQMQGSAATGLRQVGGSLDFDRGLDFTAVLGMTDPGAAKQFRDELSSYRDMAKAMGVVPAGVLDRMKISAGGGDVSLSASLSFSDLEQVRRALEPHTDGKNPL